MWLSTFHIVLSVLNIAIVCINYHAVKISEDNLGLFLQGYGGKYKFLTIWNLLLQGVFFTICFLNDILGSNEPVPKKTPFIRKVKDTLFTSLAFPLSMFVALSFWSLFAIDRELIFPKVLDKYFPVWLNHVMHTNIMIFVLLELVISYRAYPSRKVGMSILTVFMVTYLIWVHVIRYYSGMWVYPVLEVLNLPMRLVFFIVMLGVILSMYSLGEGLNKIYWSKRINAIETNKKKKKN